MKRTEHLWLGETTENPAPDTALTWIRFTSAPTQEHGGPPRVVSDAAIGFRRSAHRWACAGVLLVVEGELIVQDWREMRLGRLIDQGLVAVEKFYPPQVALPTARPLAGAPVDRGFYREVAAAYRQALSEHPERPITWLADQLGEDDVEKVRRWVRKARSLGLVHK